MLLAKLQPPALFASLLSLIPLLAPGPLHTLFMYLGTISLHLPLPGPSTHTHPSVPVKRKPNNLFYLFLAGSICVISVAYCDIGGCVSPLTSRGSVGTGRAGAP